MTLSPSVAIYIESSDYSINSHLVTMDSGTHIAAEDVLQIKNGSKKASVGHVPYRRLLSRICLAPDQIAARYILAAQTVVPLNVTCSHS